MTNEERDIIREFIERVGGAKQASGFGSVPSSAPPLPPIDSEADALIKELFAKYREAPYRLTQTAFVQEHALAAAQNRIKRLEWELEQARQVQQQAQQQAPAQGGGFFSSLFGGGQPRRPAQPQYGQGGPGPQWGQGAPPPPPPNTRRAISRVCSNVRAPGSWAPHSPRRRGSRAGLWSVMR